MEREGWDALKPHEMVELVLYHAVPRQDISDLSRVLVNRFGSVGGVFCASRESLLAVEGMTPALAEWILTTGELMRAYYNLHNQRGIRLSCWREVFGFLKDRVSDIGGARLWAVYADFDFNLITYTDLETSGDWWDADNVRRLIVESVNTGARYVYLVRFVDDARRDMDADEKAQLEGIAVTLLAVDVELVDCVLAGGGELYSMNLGGKLKRIPAGEEHTALHERYVGGRVESGE